MFRLSLKMTGRDWRAGQLRFLLVALIVAVAALSAVGFFVDRLRAGLNRDAHQLLGADLVISALEKAIQSKQVTYDFARLMDGATQVSCSGFGEVMISKMD